MFIKNGPGFNQAPDGFIYVHFPAAAGPDTGYWDGNDFVLLGRVPVVQILNRSAYQFLTSHGQYPWLMLDLSFCYITCAAVVVTVYWPSDPRHEIIYTIYTTGQSPTADVTDTVAWGARDAAWAYDHAQAAPVFQYKHMTGQDHTFYSAGLKRYVLPNYGFVDPRTNQPVAWHGLQQDQKNGIPFAQLTLFESETPWGPWALFYKQNPWNLNAK